MCNSAGYNKHNNNWSYKQTSQSTPYRPPVWTDTSHTHNTDSVICTWYCLQTPLHSWAIHTHLCRPVPYVALVTHTLTHLWCTCWPVSNSTLLQCPHLSPPPSAPRGQGSPLPSGERQSTCLLTMDQKGRGDKSLVQCSGQADSALMWDRHMYVHWSVEHYIVLHTQPVSTPLLHPLAIYENWQPIYAHMYTHTIYVCRKCYWPQLHVLRMITAELVCIQLHALSTPVATQVDWGIVTRILLLTKCLLLAYFTSASIKWDSMPACFRQKPFSPACFVVATTLRVLCRLLRYTVCDHQQLLYLLHMQHPHVCMNKYSIIGVPTCVHTCSQLSKLNKH